MSLRSRVNIGHQVNCRELITKSEHQGTFDLGNERIMTSLASFGSAIEINFENPIFLKTVGAEIISLFDNYCFSKQSITFRKETHLEIISSNIAVVGNDKWNENELVKSVDFRIENSLEVLAHKEKIDDYFSCSLSTPEPLTVIKWKDAFLEISYLRNMRTIEDSSREVFPHFYLEFAEGRTLEDFRDVVSQIEAFFSLTLAVPLYANQIIINAKSREEQIEDFEKNRIYRNHQVYTPRQDRKVSKEEISRTQSPFVSWDDSQLLETGKCLGAWMERGSVWHGAYALMMKSLHLRHIGGGDRLLNACKWLETLPNAKPLDTLTKAQCTQVSEAAIKCAIEMGIPDVENRIRNSLSKIRTENRREHFRKLVHVCWAWAHTMKETDQMVSDLMSAFKHRGSTAHGFVKRQTRPEREEYHNAISAVEAFCFYLTLKDLPLTVEGKDRATRHRLSEHYFY